MRRRTLSIRAQMYKELGAYVAPKRKASEIKADVGLSLIDVLKEVNARKEERRRSWRRCAVNE
jgi:hypothetical protein